MFIYWEFNGNKIQVGIIYRTTYADILNSEINYSVHIFKSLEPYKQSRYIIGDYNIDFQKNAIENPTSDFFALRFSKTLRWRHNEHNSVSNHQPHDCLLTRLFGRKSKKTSKLRVTGLCAGNSPGTGEFPAQRASNAGNSPVTGEFPAKRPVTRSFDVFFDLRLDKCLSKQWRGWWFETPSRPLWRHCN